MTHVAPCGPCRCSPDASGECGCFQIAAAERRAEEAEKMMVTNARIAAKANVRMGEMSIRLAAIEKAADAVLTAWYDPTRWVGSKYEPDQIRALRAALDERDGERCGCEARFMVGIVRPPHVIQHDPPDLHARLAAEQRGRDAVIEPWAVSMLRLLIAMNQGSEQEYNEATAEARRLLRDRAHLSADTEPKKYDVVCDECLRVLTETENKP